MLLVKLNVVLPALSALVVTVPAGEPAEPLTVPIVDGEREAFTTVPSISGDPSAFFTVTVNVVNELVGIELAAALIVNVSFGVGLNAL